MTSDEPLDAQYFYWLYKKIGTLENRNPARSHFQLAEQLHRKPFEWFVPNDGNRAADGKDLRRVFIKEVFPPGTEGDRIIKDWLELDCSMLEMLIALCGHLVFEANGTIGDWFWKILDNLKLLLYTDSVYNIRVDISIEQILTTVIERRYSANGHGGLFPLRHAAQDQRDIEIWYQMNAYLLENNSFD